MSLVIPLLGVVILLTLFKHKVVWWELVVPVAAGLITIVIFTITAKYTRTLDSEYWTGTIVEARYYEDWDEWIVETCECCCDEKGNNCTTYDCSYNEYHPAYWIVIDNNGMSRRISQSEFKRIVRKFGVQLKFKDMHRDYDTHDGDMYYAVWPGTRNTVEPLVTQHSYKNKIQVSSNVLNYPEVSEEEKKIFKLYDYPQIIGLSQKCILGFGGATQNKAEEQLQIANALLGKKKQVRMYVLLFHDQSRRAGTLQEAYWKGGNKNEFVVCIGLDNNNNVEWAHPFTWSDDKHSVVEMRDYLENKHGKLELISFVKELETEIEKNFKRKEFADFEYINVELSGGQVIAVYIIVLLLTVGISFWVVLNDVDQDSSGSNRFARYRRF